MSFGSSISHRVALSPAPKPDNWVTRYERGEPSFPPPAEYYTTRAADGRYRNIVYLLLNKGAKIKVRLKDPRSTPSHLAALTGNKDVVEVLLAHGAEVNARDRDGQSPLDIANCCDFDEIARLLLEHGGRSWQGRNLLNGNMVTP